MYTKLGNECNSKRNSDVGFWWDLSFVAHVAWRGHTRVAAAPQVVYLLALPSPDDEARGSG
jgi:hypothetical protein